MKGALGRAVLAAFMRRSYWGIAGMRRVMIVMAAIALVGAVACGGNAGVGATAVPEPIATATVVSEPTATVVGRMRVCAGESDLGCVVEVVIEAELVDCVGVAPMRCMVVDGELFYGAIEGFEHEAGFRYRVRMERYDPWDGEPPPADASAWGYRLVEVVEKVRAQ